MVKNDFQYGGWNSYTLQCGTIMTLISPGDCTLQCGMWLWNRDSEFTKWQHPAIRVIRDTYLWYVALGWHAIEFARWQHSAMWYVALGWHAIEFAQTSAILEFYILVSISTTSLQSTCHSAPVSEILSKSDHPRQKKWRHVDFQDGRSPPSWILGIQ